MTPIADGDRSGRSSLAYGPKADVGNRTPDLLITSEPVLWRFLALQSLISALVRCRVTHWSHLGPRPAQLTARRSHFGIMLCRGSGRRLSPSDYECDRAVFCRDGGFRTLTFSLQNSLFIGASCRSVTARVERFVCRMFAE